MTITVYRDLYGSTDQQRADGNVWAWGCAESHEGGPLGGAATEAEALVLAQGRWPDATIEPRDDRTDDA